MPAPSTGSVVSSKIESKKIAHAMRSQLADATPAFRLACKVAKKVIAPASEDAPSKWSDKIASETAFDVEKSAPVNGKYKVQPAEMPVSNAIATTIN